MRIWDISMPIHPEMPVWKGRDAKRPRLIITRDYDEEGQGGRETRLDMDAHTGTHIDAPLHFIYGGKTLDQIPIEQLIRKVKVIDLSHIEDVILPEHFADHGISRGDFCSAENTELDRTHLRDRLRLHFRPRCSSFSGSWCSWGGDRWTRCGRDHRT